MEQRSVYLLIIAVLALTVGYLGYQVSQQGDTIDVQSGQIEAGNLERDALELDLQKLRFSYDTLQTENSLMMAEMSAQRSEIEGLIKKVKDRNYSVSKLKKEAETLRRIMQGCVVTIDSLNQANIALQMEQDAMAEEVTQVKERLRICSAVRKTWKGSSKPVAYFGPWTIRPAIRVSSTVRSGKRTRRGDDQDVLYAHGEPHCRKGTADLVPRGGLSGWAAASARRPCSGGHERWRSGLCGPVAGLQRRAHGGVHLLYCRRAVCRGGLYRPPRGWG